MALRRRPRVARVTLMDRLHDLDLIMSAHTPLGCLRLAEGHNCIRDVLLHHRILVHLLVPLRRVLFHTVFN